MKTKDFVVGINLSSKVLPSIVWACYETCVPPYFKNLFENKLGVKFEAAGNFLNIDFEHLGSVKEGSKLPHYILSKIG